jgi:hypothetical protein
MIFIFDWMIRGLEERGFSRAEGGGRRRDSGGGWPCIYQKTDGKALVRPHTAAAPTPHPTPGP